MKKLLLPVMFLSALALSGATAPAIATVPAEPVAVVQSVDITADAGAVVTADTVDVATEPAPAVEPAPTEPVEPAPATEPVAATVEPVPATTAPETPAVDPYSGNPIVDCEAQGLVTAEDYSCVDPSFYDTYPAPLPTYECMEDQPCWNCDTMGNDICGNPACAAQSLFTVDRAGTCSDAPVGWTYDQLRADALYEFNSRNADPSQDIIDAFNSHYVGSGSLETGGAHFLISQNIPGVVHRFL